MKTQSVYTLHQVKRKNKRYRRIFSPESRYLYQLDTGFFKTGKSKYDKYVLSIDTFDRRIDIEPIKNLKSEQMIKAVSALFARMKKPRKSQTDKGKEYLSNSMQNYFRTNNIHHYTAIPPHKSSMAERGLLTIKALTQKLMEKKGENDWTKVIKDVLHLYNNKEHRSINTTPVKASKPENKGQVLKYLNEEHLKRQGPLKSDYSYQLRDTVRIRLEKGAFEKAHLPNFSEVIYYITNRSIKDNVEHYSVEDLDGEKIIGDFTAGELLPVTLSSNPEFKIEKVYNTKKMINKNIYRLVKFVGYKTRQYVLESDINPL